MRGYEDPDNIYDIVERNDNIEKLEIKINTNKKDNETIYDCQINDKNIANKLAIFCIKYYNIGNSLEEKYFFVSDIKSYGKFGLFDSSDLIFLENMYSNLSGVDNMSNMFYYCNYLNSLIISDWNVSNVKNMENMFGYCSQLVSLDISEWNLENIDETCNMFDMCSNLELSCTKEQKELLQKKNRYVFYIYCDEGPFDGCGECCISGEKIRFKIVEKGTNPS